MRGLHENRRTFCRFGADCRFNGPDPDHVFGGECRASRIRMTYEHAYHTPTFCCCVVSAQHRVHICVSNAQCVAITKKLNIPCHIYIYMYLPNNVLDFSVLLLARICRQSSQHEQPPGRTLRQAAVLRWRWRRLHLQVSVCVCVCADIRLSETETNR